jgi:hypothetical protein
VVAAQQQESDCTGLQWPFRRFWKPSAMVAGVHQGGAMDRIGAGVGYIGKEARKTSL